MGSEERSTPQSHAMPLYQALELLGENGTDSETVPLNMVRAIGGLPGAWSEEPRAFSPFSSRLQTRDAPDTVWTSTPGALIFLQQPGPALCSCTS